MLSYFKREPGFYKKLIALALPMVLQNLISNSMGLIDTFMVGTLGEGALAGVTLANIPIFVIQLMMFGLQSGSAVLISQYKGRGDTRSIQRVMGISMYFAGTITLVFALIVTLFPTQFLGLFGKDPAIVRTAAQYARIVCWSHFFDSFVLMYTGAHRAMGNPKRGLYILLVSIVSNSFLNWVFIFGKLGAPRLEVEGAALATLLARVLSFAIMVIWALRDRQFPLDRRVFFRPGREMTGRFIRVALPVVCNETLWSLGTSMYPTIMGHMDGAEEILAAYAISGNLTNLCTVGVLAIANVAAILIGQEIGSGNSHKVQSLGGLLDALSFLVGAVMGLIFWGLLHLLIIPLLYPLFELSSGAAAVCTMMLTVAFLTMGLRSFCTTNVVGVLRGGGDVRMAAVIDIGPLWVMAIPMAALCGLVLDAGILWVSLAGVVENIVKCILGHLRYRSGVWIRDITRSIS